MLYSNQEAPHDTYKMKITITTISFCRALEFVCYAVLYRVLSKHNDEMERNNIISSDLNRARKRVNLLSIYAQMAGFVAENTYALVLTLWRLPGAANANSHRAREWLGILAVAQFGFVSTIPIFASSELRTKFFALFRRQ